MKRSLRWEVLLMVMALAAASSAAPLPSSPPREYTLAGPLATKQAKGPAWARNLPLYQAYPHDGWSQDYRKGSYLRRTEALLPALKEMGIGVVWLLPIHPRGPTPGALPPPHISPRAQFQSLSPYCVRDFYAVDPHWGTPDDLHRLVRRAHALGMHVMMDMVINHTSWGNPLLVTHPDFYKHDADGNIMQAGPWADIAQLDYGSHAVWNYMRDMLVHWTRDYGVDGFRMDAADRVPFEFWQWLRPQLNAVHPVLLLAEDEQPRDFPAFDMAYEWRLAPLLWGLAGRGADDRVDALTATALDALLLRQAHEFPPGAVLMNHLDNHDLNPQANPWVWGGGPVKNKVAGRTVLVRYGDGYRASCVLAATLPGRPMIYNGQEFYTPRSLDPLPVPATPETLRAAPSYDFFRRLLTTYQTHPALSEGAFTKIPSDQDAAVYAFARFREGDRVLVVLNLSGEARTAKLGSAALPGRYREVFTGKEAQFGEAAAVTLEPWGCRVYVGAKEK